VNAVRAVVVDDNRLNREMIARILTDNGVKVEQAGDAVEGWKKINQWEPRLAVVDVMMPGDIDGVGLCRLIRSDSKYKDMVVVMVTAADPKKEAGRAMAAGADVLIPKPFPPKQFWTQVESLLKMKSRGSGAKVFVIDDDEKDCRLAEDVLVKEGFKVMTQTSAGGAVRAIKQFLPDLVLLDVKMPDLSGGDLVAIIDKDKSLPKRPKIVFYSNLGREELEEMVLKTGAHSYVCKVDGPTVLVQCLQKALGPVAGS